MNIRGDIHVYRFNIGVNDTGHKFISGVNNTGQRFKTGVNNTGPKNKTGVNDTMVINHTEILSPITGVNNTSDNWCQQHRW